MKRLALIGKNISHSKSKEVYKKILKEEVDYTLLDINKEEEIPLPEELFENFDGVSVTSPYKKFFIDKVSAERNFAGINCLRKKNYSFEGTNTDFFALVDIFRDMKKERGVFKVLILGDGIMSCVTREVLLAEKITFQVFSRRRKNLTEQVDLSQERDASVVVNSCSRDYVFQGKLPAGALFMDYNYNFLPHRENLSKICDYRDGLELLFLQARYSLGFWGLS